nr:sugar phosphate isomerase/epimerase [Clostridiales bacterium]
MKLCVSSGISATLPDRTPLPFEESVKLAAQAGFEEFDLGLSTRLLLQEDWEKRLHEMQEMIDRAGMQIRYVHTPYDYPRSREAEDWEQFELASMRCIEKVPELGADCAAIHPRSFMKPEYDPDEEYQEAVRFLTPYCEAAHRHGVVLGIEIMRGAGASAPAKIRRFGTDTEVLIRLADE